MHGEQAHSGGELAGQQIGCAEKQQISHKQSVDHKQFTVTLVHDG